MRRVNAEPESAEPQSAAPLVGPALRRLVVPVSVLGSVVAAFAYVGSVDPNEPGHYPACPLLRLTGIFCPGCGGLRSAHAFIHGDIAAALGANALAVVGYGVFAVVWTLWAVRAARGQRLRIELGSAQLYAVGALIAVFTLVRNLPFGAWLHP
ncbi:DUF2752 domain-containing protein [Streptomyces sp. NPDC048441]|uniref:DUF2752 domain-containing protein n=1 Tax=Streptomyces sp. NPDC048441 TaxID=3365552 RepID=UPI003713A8D4